MSFLFRLCCWWWNRRGYDVELTGPINFDNPNAQTGYRKWSAR